MRGSEVTEQILDIDSAGKARIWEALMINNRPENRVYRYNFFFDNCATRPAAIIEKLAGGKIDYNIPFKQQTFRDLINYCTRNKPWLTFGCDLALGSPTDRIATPHEMMFLPPYLKEAFGTATITGADGSRKELVSSTKTLINGLTDDVNRIRASLRRLSAVGPFSWLCWLSHSLNGDINPISGLLIASCFHSWNSRNRTVFPEFRFDTSMRLPELEYYLVTTF